MRKLLLIIAFGLLLVSLSFASAQNRIFSGEFNDTYFDVTPLTPAHVSVGAYSQGGSQFYVLFSPSDEKYYVNENNLKYDSEIGANYFYFIANVPETTQKINFYYDNSKIYSLNTNSEFQISNFNITYNNSAINFSWTSSLEDYYASIYYNESESWSPLLFESRFNDSQELNIPLEEFDLPGYYKFKLVVSDGYNEKESYLWFNVPYILWCNGADFNHDGVVDASDYITLKMNFGKYNANNEMGDVDLDGYVGWGDLQLFQQNAGSGNCNQAIFPEIPAQLLAESIAESLIGSDAPSASSSSSRKTTSSVVSNSKSSEAPVTSNVINENIESKEIKLNQFESKKGFLSKAIEALKRVFELLIKR